MRFLWVTLLFLVAPTMFADEGSQRYNLVCFDLKGLNKVLDRVVNEQQVLRADYRQTIKTRKLNKWGCSTVKVPSNSQARRVMFHKSNQNFIFPVFEIRYSNSGQRMYAVDAVLSKKNWYISKRCGQQINTNYDQCIISTTCRGSEFYDRYVGLLVGLPSDYIVVPRRCRIYTTK